MLIFIPSGSHFGRFSHAGTPTLFEWRPLAHPMGVPKPPFSRCFCKVAPLCLIQGPSWGQLGPKVGLLNSSSAPLKGNLVHIGLPSCPPGAFQATFGTIFGPLGDILPLSTLRPSLFDLMTICLLPSLCHSTVGSGNPLASHLRLTEAPSATMVSFEVSLYRMSGASTTFKRPT